MDFWHHLGKHQIQVGEFVWRPGVVTQALQLGRQDDLFALTKIRTVGGFCGEWC